MINQEQYFLNEVNYNNKFFLITSGRNIKKCKIDTKNNCISKLKVKSGTIFIKANCNDLGLTLTKQQRQQTQVHFTTEKACLLDVLKNEKELFILYCIDKNNINAVKLTATELHDETISDNIYKRDFCFPFIPKGKVEKASALIGKFKIIENTSELYTLLACELDNTFYANSFDTYNNSNRYWLSVDIWFEGNSEPSNYHIPFSSSQKFEFLDRHGITKFDVKLIKPPETALSNIDINDLLMENVEIKRRCFISFNNYKESLVFS